MSDLNKFCKSSVWDVEVHNFANTEIVRFVTKQEIINKDIRALA